MTFRMLGQPGSDGRYCTRARFKRP